MLHHEPITRPNNSICTELFVLLLENSGDSSWLKKHLIPIAPGAAHCVTRMGRAGGSQTPQAGWELVGTAASQVVMTSIWSRCPLLSALLRQPPEPAEGEGADGGHRTSPAGADECLRRHRVSVGRGLWVFLLAPTRLHFVNCFARKRTVCLWLVLIISGETVPERMKGKFQRDLVSYLNIAEIQV